MGADKHRVAIIGLGRMGQEYANIYAALPNVEIVAFVETHPERLKWVGEKYRVTALFPDTEALLREIVPDIAAVITPTKHYAEPVIACAEAGVKGISTDKPIAATLSVADRMVEVCAERGAILSGGALIRAYPETQEVAGWVHEGRYGEVTGVTVHGWSGEISGSGCHTVSVLRLMTGAEVEEVTAWAEPVDQLESDCDWQVAFNAYFELSNGLYCPVFDKATEEAALVEILTADARIKTGWKTPEIYQGVDARGHRIKQEVEFTKHGYPDTEHLWGAIHSLLRTVETGSELWISGHDLRQALEVAIASHESAKRGSIPIKLPLEDRSLTLYPRPYRWRGGDYDIETGERLAKRDDMEV